MHYRNSKKNTVKQDENYSAGLPAQAGFTLIEVMIASAIFVIIVLVGTQTLLTATNNYRLTSQVRQSLDTMNFVMEDMTRNIRLATTFHCGSLNNVQSFVPCPMTSTGVLGGYALGMETYNGDPHDPDDQVVYEISMPTGATDPTKAVLFKKSQQKPGAVSDANPDTQTNVFSAISPAGVSIDMGKSGFAVTNVVGTGTPMVTVRLAGTIGYRGVAVPFDIQSTLAPRNFQQ